MALTRHALVQYMVGQFDIEPDELTDDTPLFSSGLLDSFTLVDLIGYIENEAGIKVGATEVTLENLDTLERILAFVGRRTS